MSYFDVKLDGVSIHNPKYKEMTLQAAKVSLKLGEAGSFTFTMSPDHVFHDAVTPFGSTVEVLEDGESVFYGRPLSPQIDMYGRKAYHCEGPLAFFNDVICPPGAAGLSTAMDDKDYLAFVVEYFNSKVTQSRKIVVNSSWPITPVNPAFVHEWKYKTARNEIVNEVLKYTGGFLYTTRANQQTYLNWIDYPIYEILQPIELGVNIQDATMEGQPFYTAAIASAKQTFEEYVPTTGEIVQMTEPVILSSAAVAKYGFICAYLDAGETDSVSALESYCSTWLSNQTLEGKAFDIDALDLHMLDSTKPMYLIGRYGVHVDIPTMGVDTVIPITGIEIDVNTGRKRVLVGNTEYKTMSRQASDTQAAEEQTQSDFESGGGCCDLKDADGNNYTPYVDENGYVKGEKIPKYITFTRVKGGYYMAGATLNISDYEVSAFYNDGTSEVITSQCTFSPADGYIFQSSGNPPALHATYVVKGKTFNTGCTLPMNYFTNDDGTISAIAVTGNGGYVSGSGNLQGYWTDLKPTVAFGREKNLTIYITMYNDKLYYAGDAVDCIASRSTGSKSWTRPSVLQTFKEDSSYSVPLRNISGTPVSTRNPSGVNINTLHAVQ